jgi:hypothetical protein
MTTPGSRGQAVNFWDPSGSRADLIKDLDAAIEHYESVTTGATEPTEAAREEATRRLRETQARVQEAAETYLHSRTDPTAADLAGFAGREVGDAADGAFIGPVEGTKVLAYPPLEPVEALMVRHIYGDGQLRAYEPEEVREYIAEGRVVPANGAFELPASAGRPEPEAEADREAEAGQ